MRGIEAEIRVAMDLGDPWERVDRSRAWESCGRAGHIGTLAIKARAPKMAFFSENTMHTAYIHDPFRKFPAPDDFDDDMASSLSAAYHRPHNIFDISLDQQQQQPFNSTLPALNSSMRYDPHPPSSFPLSRHTPSPRRSRSRSRPPSSASQPGPARRPRRGNSVSSTSSPPPARPQAILIPGTHSHHRLAASLGGGNPQQQPWFINSHSSPSDFSLPTPDSVHSHHPAYTPFSLNSPTDMHLPPLSHHHHHLPPSQQQLAGSVPKDSIGSNGTLINGINSLGINMSSPTIPHHSPPQSVTVVSQVQSAAEKQAAIANEKRRRRRESHNAVERRRRDNINEKISELATLIPECMLDVAGGNAPNLDDGLLSPISPIDGPSVVLKKEDQDGSTAADTGIVKANKGMILRKSVEYIRYLQQLVTAQGARNRELEQELKMYRSGAGSDVAESESSRHLPGDMVLASESATSAGNAGAFSGYTLPPTNEDEELMMDEGHHHHHHHHHHHPYPSQEEEISSPEGSGMSNENDQESERGRTRDVVVRRTGSVPGEGVLNMNVGTMVTAMET